MRLAHWAAATLLVIPLAAGVAVPAHATGQAPAVLPVDQTSDAASVVLAKVNELRASLGLSPVTRYQELDSVAQDWSAQMAASGTFEHRPNFSSHYPSGWTGASENIAMSGGSSADLGNVLFELWRNSPGHYKNMVDPDANAIGIGVAYSSSNQAWYATQNFASYPASVTESFTVTGAPNAESPSPSPTTPSPSVTPTPSAAPTPPIPSLSPEASPSSPSPSGTPTQTASVAPAPSFSPLPTELAADPVPSTYYPVKSITPSQPVVVRPSTTRTDTTGQGAVAELEDDPISPIVIGATAVIGTVAVGAATAGALWRRAHAASPPPRRGL